MRTDTSNPRRTWLNRLRGKALENRPAEVRLARDERNPRLYAWGVVKKTNAIRAQGKNKNRSVTRKKAGLEQVCLSMLSSWKISALIHCDTSFLLGLCFHSFSKCPDNEIQSQFQIAWAIPFIRKLTSVVHKPKRQCQQAAAPLHPLPFPCHHSKVPCL